MTNLLNSKLQTKEISENEILVSTARQEKHIRVVNGLIYIWWIDQHPRDIGEYYRIRYITPDGASGSATSSYNQSFADFLDELVAYWKKQIYSDSDTQEDRENIMREVAAEKGTLKETEKLIAEQKLGAEIRKAENDAYEEDEQRTFDALQIGAVIKTNLRRDDCVVRTQQEIDENHEWVVVEKKSTQQIVVKNLKKLDLVGNRERVLPLRNIILTGKVVEIK